VTLKGLIALTSGDVKLAALATEDALELSRQSTAGGTELEKAALHLAECNALATLALVRQASSQPEEAVLLIREACILAESQQSRLEGNSDAASVGFSQRELVCSPLPISRQAQWLHGLSHSILGSFLVKRKDDRAARAAFETARNSLELLATDFPHVSWPRKELAEVYIELGYVSDAEYAATLSARAFELAESLPDALSHQVQNRIAWLTVVREGDARMIPKAVALARRCVKTLPTGGSFNTLGVALYRDGQFAEAIDALTQSHDRDETLLPYNGFFLAMAHCRLGDRDRALQWYERTVEWLRTHPRSDPDVQRFQQEAMVLLELQSSGKDDGF
jgi:tetratricopeptide (TPR) repeat protein